MPRTARASVGGVCYHVINRGNGRARVFHKDEDYLAFERLMGEAAGRISMRVIAYCLMPNHFHLVLWPYHDGDLGRWMHWLLTAHVQRYRRHYDSTGHVWQGRFKAFPIEHDEHLLTVMRYVERNPLRARLTSRSTDWPWSSLRVSASPEPGVLLHPGPLLRPDNWSEWVEEDEPQVHLESLRLSVQRQRPFGSDDWVKRTAASLGLESSLRSPGRPSRDR